MANEEKTISIDARDISEAVSLLTSAKTKIARAVGRAGDRVAFARSDANSAAWDIRRAIEILAPTGELSWQFRRPHDDTWLDASEAYIEQLKLMDPAQRNEYRKIPLLSVAPGRERFEADPGLIGVVRITSEGTFVHLTDQELPAFGFKSPDEKKPRK